MGPGQLLDDKLRSEIECHLQAHDRLNLRAPALTPAAVAIVVVAAPGGEPAFLLTRRNARLNRHSGQFALPGGRIDPGEDTQSAARRELAEELGVTLGADRVLGQLDDFATRSRFAITPVVLWGPDVLALQPNPDEVAIAYRVPLAELYRPDVPILSRIEESDASVLALPLVGTHVYTPTAAILYQFREVALEGRATRVHHFEQPLFAWQ
jgi:8-oxo-dGTP pyrophosphatase MutT (NUDIX family)